MHTHVFLQNFTKGSVIQNVRAWLAADMADDKHANYDHAHLKQPDQWVIRSIMSWIENFDGSMLMCEVAYIFQWALSSRSALCPQQDNYDDCGVFALMFANQLAKLHLIAADLSLIQAMNAQQYRYYIAYCILKNQEPGLMQSSPSNHEFQVECSYLILSGQHLHACMHASVTWHFTTFRI